MVGRRWKQESRELNLKLSRKVWWKQEVDEYRVVGSGMMRYVFIFINYNLYTNGNRSAKDADVLGAT